MRVAQTVVGILGGSGLYDLEGLAGVREEDVATPFGAPSGPLVTGTLDPPDPRYITEFGHTESEILQFAFDSLNKRLRAIGINLAA